MYKLTTQSTNEQKAMNEIKDITMTEYRKDDAISNHALQIFKDNPASYIWNLNSPSDPNKVTTSDKGTALHALLLEPETYDDLIIVADVKGRQTQAFQKLQIENQHNIILTEIEAQEVRIMADSATKHPVFNELLKMNGQCEASVFVTCTETGLQLKARPDKICYSDDKVLYCDVKTTASIDDWRSEQQWKNPLFAFGYGFTAAYYLHVGSIYHNQELTEYIFPIVQTSAALGRYPVDVFTISKDDLIALGFWDEMLSTLKHFKHCKDNNEFNTYSQFPRFDHLRQDDFIDEVEVTFTGGDNE